MNFKDLMAKLDEIEGSGTVPHDSTASPLTHADAEVTEDTVEECGGPMPMSIGMSHPGQQDSVNLSINMNGSGKGGIRDILDILRNIEGGDEKEIELPGIELDLDGPDHDHDNHDHDDHEHLMGGVGEELANEPDEMYAGMGAAVHDGDDLNKSKSMFRRAQPGDNAMATESLKAQLKNLYQEVKSR